LGFGWLKADVARGSGRCRPRFSPGIAHGGEERRRQGRRFRMREGGRRYRPHAEVAPWEPRYLAVETSGSTGRQILVQHRPAVEADPHVGRFCFEGRSAAQRRDRPSHGSRWAIPLTSYPDGSAPTRANCGVRRAPHGT